MTIEENLLKMYGATRYIYVSHFFTSFRPTWLPFPYLYRAAPIEILVNRLLHVTDIHDGNSVPRTGPDNNSPILIH